MRPMNAHFLPSVLSMHFRSYVNTDGSRTVHMAIRKVRRFVKFVGRKKLSIINKILYLIMKTIYLLIVLAGSALFAQDLEYAAKLNSIDLDDLKPMATEIIGSLRGEWEPASFYEDPDASTLTVLFYPSDTTKEIREKDLKEWKQHCQLCSRLEFRAYHEGANSDLEIAGTKKYKFYKITGKYLDLFPWWEKHFAPGSTPESLVEKNDGKRYIDKNGINIRFVEDLGDRVIINLYIMWVG